MTYTIKKGDTLTKIASEYNTTVDELVNLNGIKNKNLIYAGETLNIPELQYEAAADFAPQYTPPQYTKSEDVISSEKAYSDWEGRRPESYESKYQSDIKRLLAALSGKSFSYDAESDPEYKKYKDEYTNNGKIAMLDAMGKASALNGGFGTSYSQYAGQSAYNNYMSELSDVIPQLYKAAYGRYTDEKNDLENQIKLLQSLDDKEFAKYTNMVKNYLSEGKMLSDRNAKVSKEDYDRFFAIYKLIAS